MTRFVLVHTAVSIEVRPSETPHYSLEEAAERTSVEPDVLRRYCRDGLLGAARTEGTADPVFDDDALYDIRRIEHLRHQQGVPLEVLPMVFHLVTEVERLREELRKLRL
ncbi:MerR family transcriptional regulator [Luteolibacter ambystomatis]|uniref:MerR family transcriptional regulator n=1 Tax=Luteolibacter ambystomatis TaxID=2824561 RepID=A0A975PGA9_9BACT|nr:MerR family transcriptional regulator [Luteolibacter ambystomatis]QUE52137.1 MerR family transcriptional regulator [Luteolibacter ambystomatis]